MEGLREGGRKLGSGYVASWGKRENPVIAKESSNHDMK